MKTHEKIRQVRSIRNLSQEFMAGELRMDTSSYCRMEKGVTTLSVERLRKIASILRVSPEDLMDRQHLSNHRDRQAESVLNKIVRQLEEEVRSLREELDKQQYSEQKSNSPFEIRSR
jgi:transcriptional regulator with XRE-family HTH domain